MDEMTGIQFAHESDVLVVRAFGRYLVENTEPAVAKVGEAIKQRPVKAALIDLRGVTGGITFMDRYRLGKMAGSYLRLVPVAVVVNFEQMDKERIGLVVARNRGANIELFTDLPAAQAWLATIPARNQPPASD